jgi:hypothetical protein
MGSITVSLPLCPRQLLRMSPKFANQGLEYLANCSTKEARQMELPRENVVDFQEPGVVRKKFRN